MPVDDAAAAAAGADQRTALDPSTNPQVLAAIAQHRPDLRAAVAMNPATYPTLLEWLTNLDDPVINAALATRAQATPSAPPAPAPAPPVTTANPVTTPVPDTAAPSPGTKQARPAKHRTGLLIGATAAILILAGGGYLATQFLNTTPSEATDAVTSGEASEPTALVTTPSRMTAPAPTQPSETRSSRNYVLLSDVRQDYGDGGPSGQAVDTFIGARRVPASTTQWVGCDGSPAWADYTLGESMRLTGLLGKRDFTPTSLTFTVQVLVDGVLVESFTVGNEPIPVDVALPPGETLRLQALLLDGTCGMAPDGYLVWGDGALS